MHKQHFLPSDAMLFPISPVKTDIEQAFKRRKLLEMPKESATLYGITPGTAALKDKPSFDSRNVETSQYQADLLPAVPLSDQRSDARQVEDGYR